MCGLVTPTTASRRAGRLRTRQIARPILNMLFICSGRQSVPLQKNEDNLLKIRELSKDLAFQLDLVRLMQLGSPGACTGRNA